MPSELLAWAQAPAFHLLGSPASRLELLAFALGVAMVLANLRVNPLGWPLAIASSALYALVFADARLYGEAALQLFFIAVALWGWRQWRRGSAGPGTGTSTDASGSTSTGPGTGSAAALRVHWLAPRARWAAAAATLAAWPLLALLLARGTDSDVPWLDALPTVASVTGQLLLGRKCVEAWAVWLAVNVVSIGLFALKGLWLTVLLYAVFALLSVVGWRAWSRLAARGAVRA